MNRIYKTFTHVHNYRIQALIKTCQFKFQTNKHPFHYFHMGENVKSYKNERTHTQIAIPIRACIVQMIVIHIQVATIATDQPIVIPITILVEIDIVRTTGIQITMALEVVLEEVVQDIDQMIAMGRRQCCRQHDVYRQDIHPQLVDGIHRQLTITLAATQPADIIPKIGIQTHDQMVVIQKWTDDIIRRP